VSTRCLLIPFCLAAAACLSGCKQQKAETTSGPPPVPVSVAYATRESVPFEINVVWTVGASSTVEVKSQVAGQLLRATFQEGQNVAEGALLFEIDARPFEEALRQAEAALARDKAQLRQAQATLARDEAQSRNADADAARHAELVKAGVISKSQYDQVRTSADVYRESVRASQAAIESHRAALQSDVAAIDKAKLDISYCSIHSPVSGRTGNLLVHPGNLVRASGDTPLVVIHKITPIFVNFSVPEQHLGHIRRLSARSRLTVRVSLQDEPGRVAQGHVAVIDNSVDAATGTIKLKAAFANTDSMLWPGQFVNVALTLDTIEDATVVPAEAVQNGQQGQFIYVVKSDGTVDARVVKTGRAFGRRMIVQEGVKPGDSLVVDGQLRLFPGARIQKVDPTKLESGKL
jgi:multidrug efflux system membrane fusion protein